MYKLKEIKKIWIKNISEDQKNFINFLKNINKLEGKEFVNFIENYWRIEENRRIILVFNENFNVENNMENLKEQNDQKENELKKIFENLEINFEKEEKEIIQKLIVETKEKLKETLEIINPSEIISVETQTEIFQENKPSWQEQKIDEQNKRFEEIQSQVKHWENTTILIKQEYDNEIENLSEKIKKTEEIFQMEHKILEEKCEKLKNELKTNENLKDEEKIKTELNEEEIKLIYLNELLSLINVQIQKEQQSLFDKSKNISEQEWLEVRSSRSIPIIQ